MAASSVVSLMETDVSFVHLCSLEILLRRNEIHPLELDFLLRFTVEHTYSSPVDFLTAQSWSAVKVHDKLAFLILNLFFQAMGFFKVE